MVEHQVRAGGICLGGEWPLEGGKGELLFLEGAKLRQDREDESMVP